MKCYVHPNADAVGVCTSCGRGVCRRCAVRLGGKLYCRDDANTVFGAKPTIIAIREGEGPRRGVGSMLGAIFAYGLGLVGGLLGCLLIFAAIVSGDKGDGGLFSSLFNPDLAILGPMQQYSSSTITTLGVAALVFGFFGIAAGFYTWRPTKAGAAMSIAFGIIGLVGAFELSSISVNPVLVDAWFALSGLTIAASFVGLVQLTRSHPKRIDTLPLTVARARSKS
ncbi:MAG: DUF2180 family protein [Thaumarchaeota archaeon]|nr:DUF2180 family protein [Nitrososphaerota archaeon]